MTNLLWSLLQMPIHTENCWNSMKKGSKLLPVCMSGCYLKYAVSTLSLLLGFYLLIGITVL